MIITISSKKIEIAQLNGEGNKIWHVMIDNYYQGRVFKTQFGWQNDLRTNEYITASEIIKMIEQ